MTYGGTAARLRDNLTWLLERHRITQQIGGAGSFRLPVTTSEAERADLGAEIQRYRAATVAYCLEAVRAAIPGAKIQRYARLSDPIVALRYQLEVAHDSTPRETSLSTLFEHRPSFDLVRGWQNAARTAVEGERELGFIQWASLAPEHTRVILKDAADLARGLAVLDMRYRNVPGWQHLDQRFRLLSAGSAASQLLAGQDLDTSVDNHGWRPPPGVIQGPALPGLAGVLQAQHNAMVDLTRFPSAMNLRHVLIDQAELSRRAAGIAQGTGSTHVTTFEARAVVYRDLAVAARTLGGDLGAGRNAALESAYAAQRITSGPAPGEDIAKALQHLQHLNGRVDSRVAAAVEHGFRDNLYFIAVKLPTMGDPGPGGIVPAVQKYVPVHPGREPDLLALVRDRLRAIHRQPTMVGDSSAQGRAAYAATVALEQPRIGSRSARSAP